MRSPWAHASAVSLSGRLWQSFGKFPFGTTVALSFSNTIYSAAHSCWGLVCFVCLSGTDIKCTFFSSRVLSPVLFDFGYKLGHLALASHWKYDFGNTFLDHLTLAASLTHWLWQHLDRPRQFCSETMMWRLVWRFSEASIFETYNHANAKFLPLTSTMSISWLVLQ